MEQSRSRTQNLAVAGLYVALTCVGAFVRIPFVWVPLSLQSIFPLLAGNTLSPAWAGACQSAYLVLGLFGLPVFAQGGGIGYIMQPTFGYLLSFPIAAVLIATIIKRFHQPVSFLRFAGVDLLGVVVILFMGVFWLFVFSNFILGKSIPLGKAFVVGTVVFLPGELVKILLAAFVGRAVNTRLN